MENKIVESIIKIKNSYYTVTSQWSKGLGEVQYILTGKRGAIYGTMRILNKRDTMFLVNATRASNAPDVWLTDKNGKLEVI